MRESLHTDLLKWENRIQKSHGEQSFKDGLWSPPLPSLPLPDLLSINSPLGILIPTALNLQDSGEGTMCLPTQV